MARGAGDAARSSHRASGARPAAGGRARRAQRRAGAARRGRGGQDRAAGGRDRVGGWYAHGPGRWHRVGDGAGLRCPPAVVRADARWPGPAARPPAWVGRPLDERVQEGFLAEAGGNPLALLELPRGLTPAEPAGAFDVTAAPGLLRRLEDSFRQRLGRLPETTQRLLLVAAAEPTGDPVLVWRAAGRLGIGMEAAAPAEAEGLLTIGQRVVFRHPLVRSAAYRAASTGERRAAHRAPAGAPDPRAGPARRPRHPAPPAGGPAAEGAAPLGAAPRRA